jgi:hypothetical protein
MGSPGLCPTNRPRRIKFPYYSYPVRDMGASRHSMVHRPVIPVRVIGPNGDDIILGLADTEADETLLPHYLIGPLGVMRSPGDQTVIVGIDGGVSVVRYGTVDLELPDYRCSARVGFSTPSSATRASSTTTPPRSTAVVSTST